MTPQAVFKATSPRGGDGSENRNPRFLIAGMAPTIPVPAMPKHFHFVNAEDEASKRSAHTHRMREIVRQREWERSHLLEVREYLPRPPFVWRKIQEFDESSAFRQIRPKTTKPPAQENVHDVSMQRIIKARRSPSPEKMSDSEINTPFAEHEHILAELPDPQTILSPSRVNPFASYPMPLSPGEENLVGHCM